MNILPIIFLCLDIVSIQPNTIEKDNNQSTINNSMFMKNTMIMFKQIKKMIL